MANCRAGAVRSGAVILCCCAHFHATVPHPLRDRRSQKKFTLPGMWCDSNVKVRRNRSHLANLPLEGLGMYADRKGASKICWSDLWSLITAKGRLPSSRWWCRLMAASSGKASLYVMCQLTCAMRNLLDPTASSSCCCSLHGLCNSPLSHCVIAKPHPDAHSSVKTHATLSRSRWLDVMVVRSPH